MAKIAENEYYRTDRTLSYGKLLNIVMGNRSSGKSFAWKEKLIRMFKKDGSQFIFLKRGVEESRASKLTNYFEDVRELKFPDDDIYASKDKFYINGEVMGYIKCLKKVVNDKSISYSKVKIILYDEFLNENGDYLKNEVSQLFNLYQTVARGGGEVIRENVKIVLISNAVSLINPYFRYLNLYNLKEGYTVGKYYVIELFKNEAVVNAIKDTQFYEMIKGSAYSEYALDNSFYLDDNSFIKKPSLNKSYYYATFLFKEKEIACYILADGSLYMCRNVNKENPYKFCIGCYREKYILLERANYILKRLKNSFNSNMMFFKDLEIKGDVIEMLNISLYKG